jgi:uncharacterized protein
VPVRLRRHHTTTLLVVALLLAVGCGGDPEVPAPDAIDPAPDATDPAPDATDPAPDATDPAPDVPPLHPEVDGWDATVVTLRGREGTARVDARVATAPEQRRRGLMHVPVVPAGTGMLFVFESERTGGFWMKNTLVPLDIAFAAADGSIVTILTMTPCEADPCPTYDPEAPYAAALEVPAGWFELVGVEVGDQLTWSEPQPADSERR